MCYHGSLAPEHHQEFKHYFRRKIFDERKFEEKYKPAFHLNGFTKPFIPVIRPEQGESVLDMKQWGLLPHWVKDPKGWKANTLNARNDELFDKVSYKSYWKNRCLIIFSGFFEPRDRELAGLPGPASSVQKTESWYIKSKTEPFLTLGGIYCNDTVSIITTNASPMMEKVHNDGKRMPLILDDADAREAWLLDDLTQEEMARMMDSHPDDDSLIAYRAMDGIMNNRVDTNVPEAILPHAG